MGVGRMIGYGGRQIQELQIVRGRARSKGIANRGKRHGSVGMVHPAWPFLARFRPVFLPAAHLDILDLNPFNCVILESSSLRSR
jgi:hypothetical protein